METLQLLAVAIGLAGLAGINLYLTVFVTGLAIHQHWITLLPQYQSLEVLGHPAIIVVAGVLYFLEFFADKIPWVDSLWDSVHTVIRPVGAAFLAIQVLGDTNQVFEVLVALLGGGTALLTHGVKASTRLAVNASPEPFSNIGLSLAEDVGVLGGLTLVYLNPILAAGVLLLCIALAIYFLPRIFRMAKVQMWLIYRKLGAPASNGDAVDVLPAVLPPDQDVAFAHHTVLQEKPEWAVRCVGTGARRIPANVFGWLVATAEEPSKLHFVWRHRAETLDLEGYKVSREPKLLSENLVLYSTDRKQPKLTFVFDRTQGALVKKLVAVIDERLSAKAESVEAPLEEVSALS